MKKLCFSLIFLFSTSCLASEELVSFSYKLSSELTLGQFIDELKEEAKNSGETVEGLEEACQAKEAGETGLSSQQLSLLMPAILLRVAPELLEGQEDELNYDEIITRAKRIQDGCNQSINADVTQPVTKKPSLSGVITLLCKLRKELCECCERLEDAIDEVLDTLTECCSDIIGTLTECCEDILERIDRFEENCCPIPISALPFTIDNPGSYILPDSLQDLAAPVDNPEIPHRAIGTPLIRIEVDNVTLDLAGNLLLSAGNVAIYIGEGVNNVTVKNGFVRGSILHILVQSSSNVRFENVHVLNGTNGFCFLDCQNCMCVGCSATNCTSNGFIFEGTCQPDGFTQNQPNVLCPDEAVGYGNRLRCPKTLNRNNSCIKCKVVDCTSDSSVHGFHSVYGLNNLFLKCIVQAVHTNDVLNGSIAAAFVLGSLICEVPINYDLVKVICEDCGSKIIQCDVCDVSASPEENSQQPGGGRPVGVLLTSHFDKNCFDVILAQMNHGSGVNTCSWSPNGCFLATGASGAGGLDLQIWKVNEQTGRLVPVDGHDHGQSILSVDWSSDGCFLATGSETDFNQLKVWKVNKATGIVNEVDAQSHGNVHSVAWSPDGCFLASGSDEPNAQLRIWKLNKGTGQLSLVNDYDRVDEVNTIAWSPEGCFLVTGEHQAGLSTINVWRADKDTGELTHLQTIGFNGIINTLAWSPDGCYIASGSTSIASQVVIWKFNKNDGQITQVFDMDLGSIHSLDWSPDGNFLVGGTSVMDHRIVVWEFNRSNGHLVQRDNVEHGSVVNAVAWSPTGCFLASGAQAPDFDPLNPQAESGQLHVRPSGLIYPKQCVVKQNQISRVSGGCGGFGIVGGCNNLIINNLVYYADFGYTGVSPVYNNGLYGVPGFFDNIQIPPSCFPCGVCCPVPCP